MWIVDGVGENTAVTCGFRYSPSITCWPFATHTVMVIATHSDRLSALTNPMAWAHVQGPSACAHLGMYGSAQAVRAHTDAHHGPCPPVRTHHDKTLRDPQEYPKRGTGASAASETRCSRVGYDGRS